MRTATQTATALHAAKTHSGEAGNLVAQALGLDDGHLLADALVGVKVQCQALVVLLDDDPEQVSKRQHPFSGYTRVRRASEAAHTPARGRLHSCPAASVLPDAARRLPARTERPSSRSWCARDLQGSATGQRQGARWRPSGGGSRVWRHLRPCSSSPCSLCSLRFAKAGLTAVGAPAPRAWGAAIAGDAWRRAARAVSSRAASDASSLQQEPVAATRLHASAAPLPHAPMVAGCC